MNWHPDAAAAVVAASNGYPAHLQQLAHTVWTVATGPTLITTADVREALPRFEADLNRRTLGPRWDRISDRHMEYLAAIALHGGQTTTAHLAAALARPPSELSWIRQDLIREGDIYTVHRGHVALAVPIFAPYILARYGHARANADIALLSLDDMRRNDPAALPGAHQPSANRRPDQVHPAQPHAALAPPPGTGNRRTADLDRDHRDEVADSNTRSGDSAADPSADRPA